MLNGDLAKQWEKGKIHPVKLTKPKWNHICGINLNLWKYSVVLWYSDFSGLKCGLIIRNKANEGLTALMKLTSIVCDWLWPIICDVDAIHCISLLLWDQARTRWRLSAPPVTFDWDSGLFFWVCKTSSLTCLIINICHSRLAVWLYGHMKADWGAIWRQKGH